MRGHSTILTRSWTSHPLSPTPALAHTPLAIMAALDYDRYDEVTMSDMQKESVPKKPKAAKKPVSAAAPTATAAPAAPAKASKKRDAAAMEDAEPKTSTALAVIDPDEIPKKSHTNNYGIFIKDYPALKEVYQLCKYLSKSLKDEKLRTEADEAKVAHLDEAKKKEYIAAYDHSIEKWNAEMEIFNDKMKVWLVAHPPSKDAPSKKSESGAKKEAAKAMKAVGVVGSMGNSLKDILIQHGVKRAKLDEEAVAFRLDNTAALNKAHNEFVGDVLKVVTSIMSNPKSMKKAMKKLEAELSKDVSEPIQNGVDGSHDESEEEEEGGFDGL
jgi:hypothetical protein